MNNITKLMKYMYYFVIIVPVIIILLYIFFNGNINSMTIFISVIIYIVVILICNYVIHQGVYYKIFFTLSVIYFIYQLIPRIIINQTDKTEIFMQLMLAYLYSSIEIIACFAVLYHFRYIIIKLSNYFTLIDYLVLCIIFITTIYIVNIQFKSIDIMTYILVILSIWSPGILTLVIYFFTFKWNRYIILRQYQFKLSNIKYYGLGFVYACIMFILFYLSLFITGFVSLLVYDGFGIFLLS